MIQATRPVMGMPVTVAIHDAEGTANDIEAVFAFFRTVDGRFSPYKVTSELTRINAGIVPASRYSRDMRTILGLAERTKRETDGYFDAGAIGRCDPSGVVKGWAIEGAAALLARRGYRNYFVDAGGDIRVAGRTLHGSPWRIGIRNPFNRQEIIKVVTLDGVTTTAVATSGTYERGQHIYDPKNHRLVDEIASLTVVGPTIVDADRFATGAFAMGVGGIEFIERLPGYEGYVVDATGVATMTSGFNRNVATEEMA